MGPARVALRAEKLRWQSTRSAIDLVGYTPQFKRHGCTSANQAGDLAWSAPANALRLKVKTRSVQNTPLRHSDIKALLAECLEDLRRPRGEDSIRGVQSMVETTRVALEGLLQQARATLGVDQVLTTSADDYAANPKTVLLADLEFSPSLRLLGRLAMSA